MIKDDLKKHVTSGILFEGDYGIEIETETKSSYKIPSFTFWDVKPDGSLRDFGQEYVLKAPLDYGESLTSGLMEFHDKTKNIKFIEDSNSTSVHVHSNILKETWQTLGNYLTIYTLVENLLIEVSGDSRRNNLFCLPIRSVPSINKLSLDIFKMVQKKKYNLSSLMEFNAVKYAALNLATICRFGSVEHRSFRGVTDVEIIQSWVDILHKIRLFSRESLTPPDILDIFRDKGKTFLSEIFQEDWPQIQHDNEDKLLMDNLWFAGQLAYFFSPSEWKSFDIKLPKPIIPEGLSVTDLEYQAALHFGRPYDELLP